MAKRSLEVPSQRSTRGVVAIVPPTTVDWATSHRRASVTSEDDPSSVLPLVAQEHSPIPLGWYLVALTVYVVAGYFLKTWIFNWIIGPLFLLIALYLVPTWLRWLTTIGRRR